MARDRLAARKAGASTTPSSSYPDNLTSDNNPPTGPTQQSYPPPAQQQQQNPYAAQERGYGGGNGGQAQQTYTAVPGMGPNAGQGQGGYAQQPQQSQPPVQPYAQNQYAQQQQQQQPNQYQSQPPVQPYGQQDQYASGVQMAPTNGGGMAGGAIGGAGAGQGQDFWAELQSTNASLNEMQDMVQQVRQAHAASLSRLDTTPNSSTAKETDQLIASTRALTSHNKNLIQKLNKLAKDKAQKQQVQAAKSRFMGLLQEYQQVEKEFRKKVRDRGERQYKIVKPDATPEEVKQVLETDNPQIFSQALLSSNRYGDARGALREIQERNQDIKKIERTLTELAQMFNEMSMLVEQQDENIAVIETQANQVNTDMEGGLKHMDGAVVKARKARRKKWICFWITVLIIIIAAAIVLGIVCGQQNKCH